MKTCSIEHCNLLAGSFISNSLLHVLGVHQLLRFHYPNLISLPSCGKQFLSLQCNLSESRS